MTEKEIYAERRYISAKHYKKYLKAFYYYLKWKYYERKNMKKLIRITSIYGEEFIRVMIKKTKEGIYTDKGFVPFSDIDIIGDVNDD